MTKTYPLAKDAVFRTIQGEGALSGVPMVFVRLGGCSVGCENCDTDYRVVKRLTAAEIGERVKAAMGPAQWVFVTGGEPADHDLAPLLEALRLHGRIALATSGTKPLGSAAGLVDFLSVSPHGKPADMVLHYGAQINLVPGLNGLDLKDWQDFDGRWFTDRWVTPLWYGPADRAERVAECVAFVESHPSWRLGAQAHKGWGLA